MLRRAVVSAVTAASLFLTLPVAGANAAPPGTATVVPIQVTGTTATRFNLVILGDGYTEAESPKFLEQVDKHLNVLWSIEPYTSYRSYMNVYAIEIVSAESGVDCDPDLTSPRRDTPLNMGFWGGCNASSVRRLLSMDSTAATTYADMVAGTTSSNRQLLAIANSDTYGGAGGTYATASGGNALSALISPHELGHSLGGLQDEYDYYGRGVQGGTYTGSEPSSAHHTILTESEMASQQQKWWRWLGEPSESGGVIGRHEGGMYLSRGIWRPSAHSIMKTLGYFYDQIGREVMTRAISAKVNLVQASTPTTTPIGADRVVWVETLHPASHQLDVVWAVDSVTVPGTNNSRNLDLATLNLSPGVHTLVATVVDPTAFVRDPAIRSLPALTQTRTWPIVTILTTTPETTPVAFTASTSASRPVAAGSVVYVEPTHPTDRVLDTTWTLDGEVVSNPGNTRDLDLKQFALSPGTHSLSATVTDPAAPGGASQTLTWAVDATNPTPSYELSPPATTVAPPGQPVEYIFGGPFTMKLTGADDMPGYVVSEYRVNGDGWQNFYGWPTDPEAGMLFTEFGTNIDDLIYGKLGTPRLSPWDVVPSGQGRHTIEYRAKDAVGNISAARSFVVVLDMTQPTAAIASPADGGSYQLGSVVPASYSCGDVLSGVDSCAGTVASGQPFDTSTAGSHSFSVTARDLAGNQHAQTVTYFVSQPTAVALAGLTAARSGAGVLVGWRTGSEARMLGFNVYRKIGGTRVKLNRTLILARHRSSGGRYTLRDRGTPRRARPRYWVEAVAVDGGRAWFGPVRVTR